MPDPATMRAVVVDTNALGRLALAQVPAPRPAPYEALIEVRAVSLNRGEVRTALSASDGARIGWDIAGVVRRAAEDGSSPPAGARVVGQAPQGGWAELVALPAAMIAVLPDQVGFADAACLPVAGLTARKALEKRGLIAGKRVLVTGASGGVGTFALQLAQLAGARVTAAVRVSAQAELVRGLGADEVVVGGTDGRDSPRYDLILESVGGVSLARSLGALAPGGVCVLLGASACAETTFDASRFRIGGTCLYGLAMGYEYTLEPPAVGLTELASMVADSALKPLIGRRAPWAEVGQAAADLMARQFVGKAVLDVI